MKMFLDKYGQMTNMTGCWWRLRAWGVGLATVWMVGVPASAIAQSITSANDSVNTVVTPQGDGYLIEGGTLSGDGVNLFQSFEKFGLTQGEWATFLSTPSIDTILGRVVGGDPSIIDGLLRVTGGNSNLFLMNPSGVVFGTNARLDLPAAFNVSTATGIGFKNGWFEAFETGDYSSLTGVPLALRFDGAVPGAIVNAGMLSLSEGATLSLVGGKVVNTGTLRSAGGNVSMVSVPGSGEVELRPPGWVLGFAVEVPQGNVGQATGIAVWDLPRLLTEGAGDVETGLAVGSDGAVTVAGSGTVIPAEVGTTIASGILDVGNTAPDGVGGEVNVLGERVGVIGADIDASGTNGGGIALIGGDYQGNGTVPNALRTFVDSDSVISVNAIVDGDAGQAIFWADEATVFGGEVTARGGSRSGNGGLVEISGKESLLFQGDVDTSAYHGDVGVVLFDPLNITIVDSGGLNDPEIISDGTILSSDNIASDFTITEEVLENLSEDTEIIFQALENIVIENLTDDVLGLSGFSDGPGSSITFTADADNNGSGNFIMDASDTIRAIERNVTIEGQSLIIGNIDTRVRTDGGRSGDINLEANNDINVVGTGVTIDPVGTLLDGSLGTPGIQRVSLASFVGVSVTGGGTAGDIRIVSQNGSIDTTSAQVDASTGGAVGAGGNITIEAKGDINTGDVESFFGSNNDGIGSAGNISIISRSGSIDTTSGFLQDVSATANRGTSGDILISAANQVSVNNVSAGNLEIISQNASINALGGSISTLSTTSEAGNITLQAENNIEVGSINAQGQGVNGGGIVNVIAGGLFRASETFIDANGVEASISTADSGDGGDITITHGGGLLEVPFIVGDASMNGTAGAITTSADNIIAPVRTFPGSYTQGNIRIITPTPEARDVEEPDPVSLPPIPDPIEEITQLVEELETDFTSPYTEYFGSEDVDIKSLNEIQNDLIAIEQQTNVRPAIIYAFFVPADNDVNRTELEARINQYDSSQVITEDDQWRFLSSGFASEYSTLAELVSQTKDCSPDAGCQTDQLALLLVTGKSRPILRFPKLSDREFVERYHIKAVINDLNDDLNSERRPGWRDNAFNLYNHMLAPFEESQSDQVPTLGMQGINNLTFILDPTLLTPTFAATLGHTSQSVPISAMVTNEDDLTADDFVISRYSMGLMPSVSLTDTRYQNIAQGDLLAVGVSDFSNSVLKDKERLDSLHYVPNEVTAIGELSGYAVDKLLNSDATVERFTSLLQSREDEAFDIIHLATHAKFKSNQKNESYIHLFGDFLSLDTFYSENNNNRIDLSGVNLLVLSACETAEGSIDSQLGFAGIASQSGIQTILASTQPVVDEATSILMPQFYRELSRAAIKAEALQKAQLLMLRGELATDESTFKHPYYWALFTMIGSPW